MKKGDHLGRLGLVTDGESFPYTFVLRDVVVANVLDRSNGTARLSVDYGRCEQVRR